MSEPAPTGAGSGPPAGYFASALSRHPDPAQATAEVVGHIKDQLAGRQGAGDGPDGPSGSDAPSVAMVFVSGDHIDHIDAIVETIGTLLNPVVLVGATAVGVVGGAEEIEAGDGVALWAAQGVPVEAFRLESLPGRPPVVMGLPEQIEPGSTLVVVADPYSFPVEVLVEAGPQPRARPSATGLSLGPTCTWRGRPGSCCPPGWPRRSCRRAVGPSGHRGSSPRPTARCCGPWVDARRWSASAS